MENKSEIMRIIQLLDHHIADDFEAQDLEFKQWNYSTEVEKVNKMIKYAVCMANGGVADKVRGMDNVLSGIPFNVDIEELQKRVYENTDPHKIA